jgi:glycosyltransferase involved in cell wall biosynthesis
VFATQLQWLHERGCPVVCLHLDTDDIEANHVKGGIAGRLEALPGGRALHRWFLARPLAERALERDTGTPSAYDYFSLEGEERIARQVAIPDSLHQFLRHREVQFVLLNYGHNWPLVERLGLAAAPVMIETHDVRPVQHGLYNEEPTVESAVTLELGMFAKATCAVFINDDERLHFSEGHPGTRAVSAFPFQDVAEAPMARSLFETQASTALGALALPLDIVDEILRPRDQRTRRFAVFVGSTHKANVFSLEWFLTQVYPLGLMDPRLVILIVGSVGEALPELDLPNVYCTGRLPDLQPIYAAADVILLPIRIGTGLPIKSLDALTAGAPFVATTAAISAIPGLVEAVGAADEPEAFAERVLALAFDAEEERAFRERVGRLKSGSASWGAYAAAWDDVVRALPGAGPRPEPPAPQPLSLAPALGAPAGAAAGEFYFWSGHGLEEVVGADVGEQGLQIREPYFRLGLQCWVAGSSAESLRLSFRLSSDLPVSCLLAVDGEVQGGLRLGAEPLAVHLTLPLAAEASVRFATLELRFEGAAGGFAGALLAGLVARPVEAARWGAPHV